MADIKKPYNYSSFKPHTWESIEEFYANIFGGAHLKMLELVQHIKSSELSKRIFAYTSHDILVISIYENVDRQKESLYINFDLNSKEWHFKYFAVPFKEPEL
jgi:hypothetical protein